MEDIISSYYIVKKIGLKKVKIGNFGIIAETKREIKELIKKVGLEAF
ncbi:MAG TPA: hypothetical protein VGB37_07755 [Candidatus Lokiarchaeia archaeon]